jgi:hypothetical protein
VRGILLIFLLALTGCGTMSIPVMRHDTGETLLPWDFQIRGSMEFSRDFPFVPPLAPAAGIAQDGGVYGASLITATGVVGAFPKFNLELQTAFSASSAGWKFSGKYQFYGKPGMTEKGLAASGKFGIGTYSGQGTVALRVDSIGTIQSFDQSLSSRMFDVSVPVSYRFSPEFAVYSGLTWYHHYVSGSAAGGLISNVANDWGFNLGLKMKFNKFETDVELVFLNVPDAFTESSRFLTFIGVSFGLIALKGK